MNEANTLAQLRTVLEQDGIRAALRLLNSQTPHRFTALYRFDGETLKSLYFVDAENPEVESCPDIPVMASYCVFVRKTGNRFTVHDTLKDDRVEGHPKQREVQSYCGVPLLDESGNLFGTICVFDFESIPIGNDIVHMMEFLAPLLRQRDRTLKQG
ncbi:MAG: luxQ 8 [Chlorobi bacterium]|nr:luxQ 8 [Chlorobiota bacterium]